MCRVAGDLFVDDVLMDVLVVAIFGLYWTVKMPSQESRVYADLLVPDQEHN